MQSSMVDFPAPVSPVMAKRSAERKGSRVKSITCSPLSDVILFIIIFRIYIIPLLRLYSSSSFSFAIFTAVLNLSTNACGISSPPLRLL